VLRVSRPYDERGSNASATVAIRRALTLIGDFRCPCDIRGAAGGAVPRGPAAAPEGPHWGIGGGAAAGPWGTATGPADPRVDVSGESPFRAN
jgi:hypothetical protein